MLYHNRFGFWLGQSRRENHIAGWVRLMNDSAWTLIDLPKVTMVIIIRVMSVSTVHIEGFSVIVRQIVYAGLAVRSQIMVVYFVHLALEE